MDRTTPEVDAILRDTPGWRGETLAKIRAIVLAADPAIVEEVKWKKPSKPEGVPVWVANGNVCIGEALKSVVRVTFPKGAQLDDRESLFNARLSGNTVRSIDFTETMEVPEAALTDLVRQAVRLSG